jgi:hypothetical protein
MKPLTLASAFAAALASSTLIAEAAVHPLSGMTGQRSGLGYESLTIRFDDAVYSLKAPDLAGPATGPAVDGASRVQVAGGDMGGIADDQADVADVADAAEAQSSVDDSSAGDNGAASSDDGSDSSSASDGSDGGGSSSGDGSGSSGDGGGSSGSSGDGGGGSSGSGSGGGGGGD